MHVHYGETRLSVILLMIMILIVPYFLFKYIYVKKMKRYPTINLILLKDELFISVSDKNGDETWLTKSFDISFSKLNKNLYGELNKRGKIGKIFELRKDNILLMKGTIHISNSEFISTSKLSEKYITTETLRKIYKEA